MQNTSLVVLTSVPREAHVSLDVFIRSKSVYIDTN